MNEEKSFAEIYYEEQQELAKELASDKIKVPEAVRRNRRTKNKAARQARKKARH